MAKPNVNPLSGGPKVRVWRDRNSRPTVKVWLIAFTPIGARITYALVYYIPLAFVWMNGYELYSSRSFYWRDWADGFIQAWAFSPIVCAACYLWLRKKVVVKFTLETIWVKQFIGWKRFDRRKRHNFRLINHDWAFWEKERGTLPQVAYFNKSKILVLNYFGQRHDILSIYGFKRANELVNCLIACDDFVSASDQRGAGTAATPEQSLTKQPGGLKVPT